MAFLPVSWSDCSEAAASCVGKTGGLVMGRSLVGVLFVAVVASSACLAATEAEAPLMNESRFLKAAGTAVKTGDMDSPVQLYHSSTIYAPGAPGPYARL